MHVSACTVLTTSSAAPLHNGFITCSMMGSATVVHHVLGVLDLLQMHVQ
jgi:hypothetical protein